MTERPRELSPHGHVYGNFRKPLRERAKRHVSAQERRSGNSEKHLALIRKMPCCICLKISGKTDPHHLKLGEAGLERGLGMRATDKFTVPMCRLHHEGAERVGGRGEAAYFRDHSIPDVLELAHALWNGTGDLGRMIKILMAHRGKP